MVVVSAEKETVDQLAVAPHARVVNVLDPGFKGELEPLTNSTTLVVDLRAVLSDRMAQFVSSSVLAGLSVRHLTPVYEEHTGRSPSSIWPRAGANSPRGAERPIHPAEANLRYVDRSGAARPSPSWSGSV